MNNITIIDASAVFYSILHGLFKDKPDWTETESGKKYLGEDKIRAGIIGSFLYYKNIKHFADECIIAIDKPPYWRKDILPFYKGDRKKNKEESDIDWTAQFVVINKVMSEIETVLPWRFVSVQSLEADDVIGILAPKLASNAKVVIISADGDLVQLQKYKNVKQWSPITKKFITPKESPTIDLMTKVLRGDPGDGIPNIYSDINLYKDRSDGNTTKQKPISSKLITEAARMNWEPHSFLKSDEFIANFHRNRMLVDFEFIPKDLAKECWDLYSTLQESKFNMMNLQMYLGKHKLKQLLDSVDKF